MIFSELSDSIADACSVSNSKGAFSIAVVSAFSKSIGFVLELEGKSFDNKYFWIAPTLRSVCEDLIFLGFLDKNHKANSDEIITLKLSLDLHESLLAQEALFSEYRPHQPRVNPGDNTLNVDETEKRLKEIFPYRTVRKMAKNQELLLLYEFLYHATSRLVHFSPTTLFRMAWFDAEINVSKCAPAALNDYYHKFVTFYSAHLLSTFVARFHEEISLDEQLRKAIDENLEKANRSLRWPELVTFEELNKKNPWKNEETKYRMLFRNIFIKDPGMVFEAKC